MTTKELHQITERNTIGISVLHYDLNPVYACRLVYFEDYDLDNRAIWPSPKRGYSTNQSLPFIILRVR